MKKPLPKTTKPIEIAKKNNYENLFLTSLSGSKNIIIHLSRNLDIINCNSHIEELYNCKRENIINKNYIKFCAARNIIAPFTDDIVEKILLGESFFNIQNTISINSTVKHIIWNICPDTNKTNHPNSILLFGEDITKFKKIELQEKTIRGHLENIISHIPGYIFWKDINSKLIGCNENFAKIAGETSKSIIGKTDFDLPWKKTGSISFIKDDKEVIQSGIAKLNIEEPMRQSDGTQRFLLTNKVPLRNAKNNIIGVIGIFNDITDRKKAEIELLKAKEKSELAQKATRIFAESISHELHTPLASVSGYIYGIKKYLPILLSSYQLAKKNKLPVPNFRQNHYDYMIRIVETIEAEIKHANAIIDMTLFRINPNKLKKTNLTPCSIKKTIDQAITNYPLINQDKKSLINLKIQNDFIYLGEELFLIHMIFNLLKNAIFYIEKEKKGEIYIWTSSDHHYNLLHFKDTSKGISTTVLPKIFDLYYSETPHGTGVGLAFCKQVMQIFFGEIECRSEEGKYAEFILKFPKLDKKIKTPQTKMLTHVNDSN